MRPQRQPALSKAVPAEQRSADAAGDQQSAAHAARTELQPARLRRGAENGAQRFLADERIILFKYSEKLKFSQSNLNFNILKRESLTSNLKDAKNALMMVHNKYGIQVLFAFLKEFPFSQVAFLIDFATNYFYSLYKGFSILIFLENQPFFINYISLSLKMEFFIK